MTGPVTSVIFLPGVIMPSALRYAALLRELGNDVVAITKDLELYGGPVTPPPGYEVATEVEAVSRAADAAGLEKFHLYGHSGGGAVALAYVAAHPQRVLTLAVDEPAYDFLDAPETEGYWDEIEAVGTLPASDRLPAFLRLQLAPGVPLPPPPQGAPPPWMASRAAGVPALASAMHQHHVNPDRYRHYGAPVYFSHGSLSHPYWLGMRDRLAALFPDFTVEGYEDLHHLNTSHQAEPTRVAAALRRHWSRALTAQRPKLRS
jgi:pimeloyl-ACP methyl ester carboxylesterase